MNRYREKIPAQNMQQNTVRQRGKSIVIMLVREKNALSLRMESYIY